MSENRLGKMPLAVAAAAMPVVESLAAEEGAVADLIAKIKDKDHNVRSEARDNAGKVGAPAIKPLAAVMSDEDFQVARAAKRALWKIVRHAGRPGADGERTAVGAKLLPLLSDGQPTHVRREVMWMLSEIAGDEAVAPVAGLLSNEELREDARMVLERIPGERSLAALRAGLNTVPEGFKINIAQSLRARGVAVRGFPCQKLVPTRETKVEPVG
jgi:HEAT repeat protein